MPNYAIMRTRKIKSMIDLKFAIDHNRRERLPLNALPEGSIKHEERLQEFCDRGVDDFKVFNEKVRKNAVRAVEWVLTASDLDTALDTDEKAQSWVDDNIKFVADKMGGTQNILSAVVHFDEKSPHLHIITIPQYENKLNCKHYLGGSKWVMRDLQNDYFEAMKKYGLDRGEKKEITKSYHEVSSFRKEIEELKKKKIELENEIKKNELEIKKLDLKYDEYKNNLEIKVETKKEKTTFEKLTDIEKIDLNDIDTRMNELEKIYFISQGTFKNQFNDIKNMPMIKRKYAIDFLIKDAKNLILKNEIANAPEITKKIDNTMKFR